MRWSSDPDDHFEGVRPKGRASVGCRGRLAPRAVQWTRIAVAGGIIGSQGFPPIAMNMLRRLLALPCLALVLHAAPPADFTVESAVGGPAFTLSAHRGKLVALHFLLKTECPYCLRHTLAYAALAATTPEVVHVFLKPDSAEEIRVWAGQIKAGDLAGAPNIRDPEAALAKAYGIPGGYKFHGQEVHFPALVLLDRDGKERWRYVGRNNGDRLKPEAFTARLAEASAAP